MLIGLAAKNAILIVEFANIDHDEGATVREAALESAAAALPAHPDDRVCLHSGRRCRSMLRKGAGAGAQNVMGTAVFWGMLVATFLGVFLIPGNFAFVEGLGRKRNDLAQLRRCHRMRGHTEMAQTALALIAAFLLSGCTLGPDYLRPSLNPE